MVLGKVAGHINSEKFQFEQNIRWSADRTLRALPRLRFSERSFSIPFGCSLEPGDTINDIHLAFDPLKAHHPFTMTFFTHASEPLTENSLFPVSIVSTVLTLLIYMSYHIDRCNATKDHTTYLPGNSVSRIVDIKKEACQEKEALAMYGILKGTDACVPLCAVHWLFWV